MNYDVLEEGWAEFGTVRCEGCGNDEVDLSDAETFGEAVDIWNDHVREVHHGGS